jgi:hypothetical protein
MGRSKLAGLILSLGLVVFGTVVSTAGAFTTPPPGDPPPVCGAYYPGDCLITTRNGGLTLSPKIVRAGEDLTGTITNRCTIGYGNNDPCPVGWGALTVLGKVKHGCKDKDSTCVVKIAKDEGSSDYTALNVTVSSAQGAGYSSDYYAIVGRHQAVVEGKIANKDDTGAPGVNVAINGAGRGPFYEAVTGQDGHYAADVKAGHYRVFPEAKSVGARGKIKFSPDKTDVHAPPNGKATANFELDAGLVVSLDLSKSSVVADGGELVNATVHVSEYGKPVNGQTVELWPQDGESSELAVTSGPRVLMCQTGNRLWPTGSLQDPDGISFNATTDANGNYSFTLFVGTVPGTWKLTAWAKDANGNLITHDTTDTSDDKTLTVTPVAGNTVPVEGFVQEYDTVELATNQASGIDGTSISSMLGYFWLMTLLDNGFHGLAFAPVQGNSSAILVYQAASTPNIAANGTVTAHTTDEVLEPSEWTVNNKSPVGSLTAALQKGKLQQLPDYSQWTAGTTVPGWTGQAQTMSTTSGAFQYFGWPLPSTATGSCS